MKKIFALFTIILVFSACTKIIKDVNIDKVFNSTIFCGLEPDISYYELCNRMGEPNDYYKYEDRYESSHNPLYYTPYGKIMCWWSGSKRDPIGNIEFTPHQNIHIRLTEILDINPSDYGISYNTKKIKLANKNYPIMYYITLEDMEVKKIWMGTYRD